MAEEFVKVEVPKGAEESENVMNTSDYAQVIFHDIAESYPVKADIVCKYTVTPLLQATTRDWVGLYRVGWTSSRDHVYYEWAKLPENQAEKKAFNSHIIFKATTLPADDGEFYQFCYVTSSGQVRGASTPFQFKRLSADQFVEIEDLDDDIMVIKSKTSALEDELGCVRKERETLVKGRDRLEQERESLLSKLMLTEKKLTSGKEKREALIKDIESKEARVESLQSEVRDMAQVSESLRDKISKLSEEKMTLVRKLDEKDNYTRSLQEKVKALINEKDSLMGKNRMLEDEKDLYKKHFSSSESTLQGHLKEIDDLKKQLSQEEVLCGDLKGQIGTLGQELELTINKLNEQERTVQQDKEQIDILTEQVKCNQEKIEALEQCKTSLGAELETVNLTLTDVSEKWEKCKNEAHKYKEQVKLLEQVHENQTVTAGEQIQELTLRLRQKSEENERLNEESAKLRSDIDEMAKKSSKQEDAPIAYMKMAHKELKKRLNRAELRKEELAKTVEDLQKEKELRESSNGEMKREIEDLKERLLMGQEEYKNKYVECQKLRRELKKLQKKVCQSRSPRSSETGESQSNSFTQTCTSTGDKHTETDPKSEAEQTTQTKVRCETENHTQTSVNEKETETQTSVCEKDTETQTSVKEGDELADLTNPELMCQLDDLGKELITRNARKQKYKELYHQEREKCAYLQRHYYEELEKKDQELEKMHERVKYLETCLSKGMSESELQHQNFQGQFEAYTPLYPPQLTPGSQPIPCPIISQPGPSPSSSPFTPPVPKRTPPKIPPRFKKPESSGVGIYPPQNTQGKSNRGVGAQQEQPQSAKNGNYKGVGAYPKQPLYPAYYDNQPIVPNNNNGLPASNPQSTQAKEPADPVSTVQLKELDPLSEASQPKTPAAPPRQPALIPPLQPEILPSARVAQVLGAVSGNFGHSNPTSENTDLPKPCPCEAMGIPDIKMPPEPSAPTASDKVTTETIVSLEMDENREEGRAEGNPGQRTEEPEEERFFDAQEAEAAPKSVMKQCPMCEMTFDLSACHLVEFEHHVEEHFTSTKDCPMCGKKFSSDTDNQLYVNHVNRHFEEEDTEGFTQV